MTGRRSRLPPLAVIAARAGVSVPTVSKVLNARPGVAPSTRARVRLALDDLGVPDTPRRPRRHGLIDLRVDNLLGLWSEEVVRGAVNAGGAAGVGIVVSVGGPDGCDTWVGASLRRGTDALVCAVGLPTDAASERAAAAGVPLVAVDPWRTSTAAGVVTCDNASGAYDAVAHLLGLGHRRIGVVAGPLALVNARERLGGYRRALAEAGIAHDDDLVQTGDYTAAAGYRAGTYFLALESPPTAVFAASDDSAFGLVHAYREAGLDVPGDLSVVGFDDLSSARWVEPPLTTVHQPVAEMGASAVRLAVAAIAGGREARGPIVLETHLVLRATTGPPRA